MPHLRRHPTNAETVDMSGGRALAEMMKLYDVGPMFGMGGFQLLPFYDAVGRLGLTHHLVNDERTGIFAACAWAQATLRPGVCDATLGPGVTNLLTGLCEALNAGEPLVVLTGDANREHAGKNMTQEANQVEILRPAVKDLIRVEHPLRIPAAVRRAFAVATSGRPGPVVIDLPEDVCHTAAAYPAGDLYADTACMKAPSRRSVPAPGDIAAAAQLLGAAKRPLILAGGGIHLSDAYAALAELAEAQSIPVAHTMTGKGAMACTHPLSAGLFGRYSRIGNDLIDTADCLLVVGCKLGEIATKRYQLLPPDVPVIHLDVLAEEFGRTTQPALALWGDAREGLAALAAAMPGGAERTDYVDEVGRRMAAWREETADRRRSDETPVHTARLVQEISDRMPADGVLVADGGFAAHWASFIFETKRAGRGFIADRGFASIGFGVPGALGVHLARPGSRVVALTGDGGFNMSLGDMETLLRTGADVTVVIVNNAASGYVKALQHALFDGTHQSSDLVEMDYAAIARAMGCHGIRVETPAALGPALEAAFAEKSRPSVVDVMVTRDPDRMLPAADSRTVKIEKGDRPV